MAKTVNVEILGRNLGTAMSCEEKTYHAFTLCFPAGSRGEPARTL